MLRKPHTAVFLWLLETVLSSFASCLQVQLSVIDDGTLAIEATVYQLLAQWPYLSDLSLIWAAASIFEPASPAEVAGARADPAHQAAAAAAHRILQEPAVQPWLYFNLIAHNSHVFAPVMDLVGSPPELLVICKLSVDTWHMYLQSGFSAQCILLQQHRSSVN